MRLPTTSPALPSFRRGKAITVMVDGRSVQAFEGETVATVLHAEGITTFARKHPTGKPSGVYCGMGICYECLVTIDGAPNVRACQTQAADRMVIETGRQEP